MASNSKVDVLNRLLYMLEENSVVAQTSKDREFRRFIVDIYSTVSHKVDDLSGVRQKAKR